MWTATGENWGRTYMLIHGKQKTRKALLGRTTLPLTTSKLLNWSNSLATTRLPIVTLESLHTSLLALHTPIAATTACIPTLQYEHLYPSATLPLGNFNPQIQFLNSVNTLKTSFQAHYCYSISITWNLPGNLVTNHSANSYMQDTVLRT